MDVGRLLAGFAGRPVPPDRWSDTLSQRKLISLTKSYLIGEGWTILSPWDWLGIHIRATRPGHHLNMMPISERMMRWNTLIKDVREAAGKVESIVGVLTTENVHELDRQEALDGGSYIVTPVDLPNIANILALAVAQKAKLTAAADQP